MPAADAGRACMHKNDYRTLLLALMPRTMMTPLSLRLFRYVLAEVLPFILLAFLLLTTLIFAQQIGRQSDVVFNSATTLALSLRVMASLLPGIIVITLPFALLIGTLMALNRLSSDSEIVAAKACGVSLFRLSLPLVACGLAGSGIAFYLTQRVIPRTVSYGKEIGSQILLQALAAPIKPQTFDTHFPDTLVYVRDIEKGSGDWIGVFLVKRLSDHETGVLTARRGRLRLSPAAPVTLEAQLTDGLALQMVDAQPQRQSVARFERQDIRLSENDPLIAGKIDRARTVQEMPLGQLARQIGGAPTPLERRQAAVEWHKRWVLPLACLCLTLMAVPVGTRTSRHAGRAIAFTLGFGLAIAYYLALLAGQNLALSGALPPWLGVWLPNLAAATAAASALTARSRRRAEAVQDPQATLGSRRLRGISRLKALSLDLTARAPRPGGLINYLVLSETAKYFLLSLGVLLATSLIFTLFDLLPSLLRSGLGWRYGAAYLAYLAPQIVYFTAPFALLLALLSAHGVLARSNQLTALLASGQSVWRVSLPLALVALAVVAALFYASDAVLPSTNREQDERYHRVKGRKIEQAAIFAGQKWVGDSNRNLYSYERLTPDNILLNATVYSFSPQDLLLRELTFARQAAMRDAASWQIKEGWRYDLSLPGRVGYQPLSEADGAAAQLRVADGPSLFTRTVNEATKMTFADLRDYLGRLRRLGAPSADLRVEYEKKKAFPFSCLTLLIAALPLLPIHTRRSALAGLGVSIILGFAFWITSSLFEAAGKQSLLPAWLAAWGGQAIFLLLGVYLMLRRKTK